MKSSFDKRVNLLADALYYTRADSGASCEKAQGVVIGAVNAIMGLEKVGFFLALDAIKANLPDNYRIDAIPKEWQEYFD